VGGFGHDLSWAAPVASTGAAGPRRRNDDRRLAQGSVNMAAIESAKANAAAAHAIRESCPKMAPFVVRATVLEDRRVAVLLTMGGHAFTGRLVDGKLAELWTGWPVAP
jgi:hypothetical protein